MVPRRLLIFSLMLIVGVLTATYIRDVEPVELDSQESPDYLQENQRLYELQSTTEFAKSDHDKWCPAIPAVADADLKATIKRLRRESGVE